jgi:outer membrane murein-binding lipoprotein Lpp
VPKENILDFEEQAARLRESAVTPPVLSGGGPHMPDMDNDRLGKLEGQFDGLKHNQTITFAAIALVSAILLAVSSYSLIKLDTLSNRISELPSKISADLRDITSTLSQAITATKQQSPQVIFIPAPQPVPAPSLEPSKPQ